MTDTGFVHFIHFPYFSHARQESFKIFKKGRTQENIKLFETNKFMIC